MSKLLKYCCPLLVFSLLMTGCGDKGMQETENNNNSEHQFREIPNYVLEKDEDLKVIGRELLEEYTQLSNVQSKEEYDAIRKEVFMYYDVNAPLENYKHGQYSDVKIDVEKEKVIKSDSYFLYDTNYTLVSTFENGKTDSQEGHIQLEIMQDHDHVNKITYIR